MFLYLLMGNDFFGILDVGCWVIIGMDVQLLWGIGGNGMSNDQVWFEGKVGVSLCVMEDCKFVFYYLKGIYSIILMDVWVLGQVGFVLF